MYFGFGNSMGKPIIALMEVDCCPIGELQRGHGCSQYLPVVGREVGAGMNLMGRIGSANRAHQRI